jgi:hypothetical protein
VMVEVERDITITSNQIPFVNITFGPANPEYGPLFPYIETSHSDNVVRVDFFDNGVWMGHDTEIPFGDGIEDLQGNRYMIENGQHNLTAKAYNKKGVESPVSSIYQFVMDDQFSIINSKPVVHLVGSSDRVVLARGDTLEINVTVTDADGPNDLRKVSLYKGIVHSDPGCLVEIATDDILPLDHLAVDTSNWELGVHLVKIHAFDATGLGAQGPQGPQGVQGVQLSTSQGVSYPVYLLVEIHDGSVTSFAERLLDVLVDDVGSNLLVSNSKFNGIEKACGVFDHGIDSGLLMMEGVVLTTGENDSWNAGDNSDETSTIWCSAGSLDLDLEKVGRFTEDAASLEFDVLPGFGQLEIVYQFASEEYDEYINQYNDTFIISVNNVIVSRMPDCDKIISVDSVNLTEGAYLFLDDELDIINMVTGGFEDQQLEYDGITVDLKAHVLVSPGAVKRVKLTIADVNDGKLDSALFIKKSSIRSIDLN